MTFTITELIAGSQSLLGVDPYIAAGAFSGIAGPLTLDAAQSRIAGWLVEVVPSSSGGSAPVPQYAELLSHKDQASGYAGLDSGGLLKMAEMPGPVVLDSRAGGAIPFDSTGAVTGNVPVFDSVEGVWEPGAGGTPTVSEPGNLGAARTIDFASTPQEIWLVGTLNADCTITLTNRVAGCRALLMLTQDTPAHHAVSISDGSSSSAIPFPQTAGAVGVLAVDCPDATAIYVSSLSAAPSGGGVSDRWPGWLFPFDPFTCYASPSLANFLIGHRVTAPIAGHLHDVAVPVVSATGNVRVGVYDTGDATAGQRTLLWDSGSVAAVNGWQVVGDPNLSVLAGQALDLAIVCSAGCGIAGVGSFPAGSLSQLPNNFLPAVGGGKPFRVWNIAFTFAALPATIAEASLAQTQTPIWCPIARVA